MVRGINGQIRKRGTGMTVRELRDRLAKLDSNLNVVCYSEGEAGVDKDQLFRLFYIESVDVTEAERVRQQDGTPSLKLEKTDASEKIVLLTVTGEF